MKNPSGCDAIIMNADEKIYYSRQMRLPFVGKSGQARLKDARVAIVGAGALGVAVAPNLAGAGVGHITIVDNDVLELSNLQRQVLYEFSDVGIHKALLAERRLKRLNPFIEVHPMVQRVSDDNVDVILRDARIVVDCTDNIRSKFLLHDFCRKNGVDFVSAALYRNEGHLHVFNNRAEIRSGCLRCIWPDEVVENSALECNAVGVMGAVSGVMGSLQAFEVIRLLLGLDDQSRHESVIVDLDTLRLERLARDRNSRCPFCGDQEVAAAR